MRKAVSGTCERGGGSACFLSWGGERAGKFVFATCGGSRPVLCGVGGRCDTTACVYVWVVVMKTVKEGG
eukprot:176815-Prorocentrum_lima.AAC.1